jgi:hypothetical protein
MGNETQSQLLPLDIERVVVFPAGGKFHRHTFNRIGGKDWEGFFSKIDAEVEQRDGTVTRTISTQAAMLWLYSQCVKRAEGYRVSDGRALEDLPQWRERVPQGHRLKAADILMQCDTANAAEDLIEAEGDVVTLDAVWSEVEGSRLLAADDPKANSLELIHVQGGMRKFCGLVHHFAAPSAEHRRRFLRARSRAVVAGGGRSGKTIIPSAQPLLMKLYDELVISVEGYSIAGRPLSGREEIAREMDGYHKVVAAAAIFTTTMPAELTEN